MIINPIIRLARYAGMVGEMGTLEVEPFTIHQKDEIGELGNALNELYGRLRKNYLALEENNHALERENKRREVFLRASSHQLKTPISAALLLVEGMIDGVGKYKDTASCLPRVKAELCKMRDIIDDILYLNHCTEHVKTEPVEVKPLLWDVVENYQISMEDRGITVRVQGDFRELTTDRDLFKKILDNLVSNAVHYTEKGGEIVISPGKEKEDCSPHQDRDGICIWNHPSHIEEELCPHIFEPFVSSEGGQKGKGLGLYIAAYYGEILGYKVKVENQGDGVTAGIVRNRADSR